MTTGIIEITEAGAREYELAFLLNAETAAAAVEELLAAAGAEIFSRGPLRTIALSYPIKKQETAFWGFLVFRSLPEKITAIRQTLHLNPQVIRFLLITPPVAAQEARRRGATMEKPERPAEPIKAEHPRPPILSNEALEKQIEEILG